jgi:cell division protein FtsI (penicillin-binding protein 3)
MSIRQSILSRVTIAFTFVVLMAAAIIIKIFVIQFVEGEKWRRIAEENGLRYLEVQASRGNILSTDGSVLSTSIPFYRLAIDPIAPTDTVFNAGIDSLSMLLANYFGEKTKEEYKKIIEDARKEKKRYRILSRSLIQYQDTKILKTWPIFREGRRNGGVIFEKVEKRFRPFEDLARRTLGFTMEDSSENVQGRGLEYSFNEELAGVNGKALYQKMAGGWKPVNDASQVRPENGLDVVTTIDVEMQDYATRILKETLERNDAEYGCVILMEVKTGELKAVVNLGKQDSVYVENFNYAVAGVAEPGSTFKLASMMALLDESNAQITDTVNTGNGKYEFYDECVMTDATEGGYGLLSVKEVFEKSSNIGMSKLVFRYFREKPEKFLDYLESYGLTEPIPFQMSGVGMASFNRPGGAGWSGCSLPWMSIGYELRVSPLHTLLLYNAVANGGKMISPLIVKEVRRGGRVVESFEPEVLNRKICSDKTLFTLQGMLEGVVERGTAKNILGEKYKIAGKTGTAKKFINGQYTKKYYASFAGYFPSDEPLYSCIVIIDEPSGDEQYGGKVAAPVFKKIADKIFAKSITKSLEKEVVATSSLPTIQAGNFKELEKLCKEFSIKYEPHNTEPWVRTSVATDTVILNNVKIINNLVPDVRGMTLRDAVYILENQGLKVKCYGNGRVKSQSIRPGTRAVKGNRIFISLG